MLAEWFGPRGFSSTVPELDLRVGGSLHIVMHGPDGNDYPMKGTFRESPRPNGSCSAIRDPMTGQAPADGLTTVTFAEHSGKTTMTLQAHAVGRVPIAKQMLTGMQAGWSQSIDKLGELLKPAA